MTTFARWRRLDSRVWSTASWLSPLTTQIVMALVIVTSWLVGKWLPGTAPALLFLAGAGADLLLCAAVALAFLGAGTFRAQGAAMSIAGAYGIVLVGGPIYGFWILEW
jgi:hypothetical protein